MQDADVIPLRIISSAAQLYVNASGDPKEILLWVATHEREGQIHAGPDNAPGHAIKPSDGTVFLKVSVEANESIRATPGHGGIVAVRLVQV